MKIWQHKPNSGNCQQFVTGLRLPLTTIQGNNQLIYLIQLV